MLRELSAAAIKAITQTETLPPWADEVLAFVHIPLLLLGLWVLRSAVFRILQASVRGLMARVDSPEERKRIETLARVVRYVVSVVLIVVSIMLVLSEFGISIAPLLAGAGVAGLAIGFGAQSLVKDYFSGIVMLLENQIRQGDVVEVAGKSGLVEEVTLRYVRLRDYEGAVHYIPNGHITTVSNKSRQFAFAVMDIGVGYDEDLERVAGVMRQVAESIRQDPAHRGRILEPLEVAGVDAWADKSLMIRCRIKVTPLGQGPVRREFLQRLKDAFDAEGIAIPAAGPRLATAAVDPAGPAAAAAPK